VLWSFGGSGDGARPLAGLIGDKRGNLYGTSELGGVFELSPPAGQQTQWRESVLWTFGASGDGQFPVAGLLADKSGNLYGTTLYGGTNNVGTVFELSPPSSRQTQWSERVLWSFGASGDGNGPSAGLIADKSGNLYGTTQYAGANNGGIVFELSPPVGQQTQWKERVLWNFGPINVSGDGSEPYAGLIADQRGNLYGTTVLGGAYSGGGTVFELSPPTGQQTQWSERVLWSFGANDDAARPFAGLILNRGNLYGTTSTNEGVNVTSCCGTVFELSPPAGQQTQWRESVLWSFGVIPGDGATPYAGLIADKSGNLYGTTLFGGAFGGLDAGTVFELSPPAGQQTQWRESVLWSFGASGDGNFPTAGLLADRRGNLYGTTGQGGANSCFTGIREIGCGTVFKLSLP